MTVSNTERQWNAYVWHFPRGEDGEFDIPGLAFDLSNPAKHFEPDDLGIVFGTDIDRLFGSSSLAPYVALCSGESERAAVDANGPVAGVMGLDYEPCDTLSDALAYMAQTTFRNAHVVQMIPHRGQDGRIDGITLCIFW